MPKTKAQRRLFAATPYKRRQKYATSSSKIRRVMAPRTIRSGFVTAATPSTMGFPAIMRARLRYVEPALALNPFVATVATQVYRLNSLHDPDLTNVGHQPRAFDEYAALYRHYQVHNCRWRLSFNSTGANTYIVGYAIRRASVAGAGGAAIGDWLEQGDVKWAKLGQNSGGSAVLDLTGAVNIKNWLGIQANESSRLEALTSDNPDEQLYLHVFAASTEPANDPVSLRLTAQLDYDASFREKMTLTES